MHRIFSASVTGLPGAPHLASAIARRKSCSPGGGGTRQGKAGSGGVRLGAAGCVALLVPGVLQFGVGSKVWAQWTGNVARLPTSPNRLGVVWGGRLRGEGGVCVGVGVLYVWVYVR